jgi:hypothetical protein
MRSFRPVLSPGLTPARGGAGLFFAFSVDRRISCALDEVEPLRGAARVNGRLTSERISNSGAMFAA